MYKDAAEFLTETRDKFDVIIIDSSDPVGSDSTHKEKEIATITFAIIVINQPQFLGPAESLFSADFYRSVQGALSANGIMAAQVSDLSQSR